MRQHPDVRLRGFTLIELLVVIAIVAILVSDLEQTNTFTLYDSSLGNSDPVNTSAVKQFIPAYLCSAAPLQRSIPISGCDANDRAPGTYAFCTGSGDPWGSFAAGTPHNGAIVNPSSGNTSMRDVTDGTSNTLLTGEAAWNLPDYLFTSGPCTGQIDPTTHVAAFDPTDQAWSVAPALQGNGMEGFGTSAFALGDRLVVTTMSGSVQALSDDGSQ